jgi:hypothetical protein
MLTLGGRYRNKFTPMLDEILRWRGIIVDDYECFGFGRLSVDFIATEVIVGARLK